MQGNDLDTPITDRERESEREGFCTYLWLYTIVLYCLYALLFSLHIHIYLTLLTPLLRYSANPMHPLPIRYLYIPYPSLPTYPSTTNTPPLIPSLRITHSRPFFTSRKKPTSPVFYVTDRRMIQDPLFIYIHSMHIYTHALVSLHSFFPAGLAGIFYIHESWDSRYLEILPVVMVISSLR